MHRSCTASGRVAGRNKQAELVATYDELAKFLYADKLPLVGSYVLGKVLGNGSSGRAYLASHMLTGTLVVIKSGSKVELANFAREIYHHRQLRHPHIAKLFEVISTESHVWLVMEYCAKGELYDYLLAYQTLPLPRVREIFAQICGAVAYLHSQNLAHRDLKLENIFLTSEGQVKLGDFGFTRNFDGKKMLQTWCGTIAYAAPEMLRCDNYVAEAVDIWSLGIILYALCLGRLPFDEDSDDETKRRILEEEMDFPESLPEDAVKLIKAMLNRNPTQRISSRQILEDPFLESYGEEQLKMIDSPTAFPFSSELERSILENLKKLPINTDSLVESVLENKADFLAGFWHVLFDAAVARDCIRVDKKEGTIESDPFQASRGTIKTDDKKCIEPYQLLRHQDNRHQKPTRAQDAAGSAFHSSVHNPAGLLQLSQQWPSKRSIFSILKSWIKYPTKRNKEDHPVVSAQQTGMAARIAIRQKKPPPPLRIEQTAQTKSIEEEDSSRSEHQQPHMQRAAARRKTNLSRARRGQSPNSGLSAGSQLNTICGTGKVRVMPSTPPPHLLSMPSNRSNGSSSPIQFIFTYRRRSSSRGFGSAQGRTDGLLRRQPGTRIKEAIEEEAEQRTMGRCRDVDEEGR